MQQKIESLPSKNPFFFQMEKRGFPFIQSQAFAISHERSVIFCILN